MESHIRALAERHGLEVLKRITAGGTMGHFATFELAGTTEKIAGACKGFEALARPGFDRVRYSDVDGKPYIEFDSVWCEAS